jgi:hypothetical protein
MELSRINETVIEQEFGLKFDALNLSSYLSFIFSVLNFVLLCLFIIYFCLVRRKKIRDKHKKDTEIKLLARENRAFTVDAEDLDL